MDVSSSADDKGKVIAEDYVRSDPDMDLDELRMIDEGLTQLEVRMDGGSRTIIPMDRDTEEVVPLSILSVMKPRVRPSRR